VTCITVVGERRKRETQSPVSLHWEFGSQSNGGRISAPRGIWQFYGDECRHRAERAAPLAVEVMEEIGIDISQQNSKDVVSFLG
jgi:hypothetical protein